MLSACKRGYNDRGLEFAPQMYVSKPYEPYTQTKANPINPQGTECKIPCSRYYPKKKIQYRVFYGRLHWKNSEDGRFNVV